MCEALRTKGLRQGIGVLVVPCGLRVDEHAEPRGARRRLAVDEVGVQERVAPVLSRLLFLRRFDGIEDNVNTGKVFRKRRVRISFRTVRTLPT